MYITYNNNIGSYTVIPGLLAIIIHYLFPYKDNIKPFSHAPGLGHFSDQKDVS